MFSTRKSLSSVTVRSSLSSINWAVFAPRHIRGRAILTPAEFKSSVQTVNTAMGANVPMGRIPWLPPVLLFIYLKRETPLSADYYSVSCFLFRSNININDVLGNYSLTLIDTLDTLLVSQQCRVRFGQVLY